MELEVREIGEDRLKAVVTGTNASFVNAIRRTLIADVPKLSVEDVTIYDNTSALFDEVVAHRLGLVPIPTPPGQFNRRNQCTCGGEGCPSCIIIYTLSKEGPATVLSGDLAPQDPKFAIPDPKIPIVTLLEGQRLMLEAVASLGSGRENVKWSPVIAPGYKEYPKVKVKDPDVSYVPSSTKLCPVDVLVRDDGKLKVQNVETCTLCGYCEELLGPESIEIDVEPDRFVFRFETDRSMSARDAMKLAIGLLKEKLKEFEEKLDGSL